jgi:DNA-directed RNA polymerase subunit F
MSKKKSLLIFHIFFALAFLTYLLWPTDEGRVKKLFKEGAEAIEREDLDAVMSKVSFNYHDVHGFSYLALKQSMQSVFNQLSDIKITQENLVVKVRDKTATADMDVRIIATKDNDTGYVIGDLQKPVHLRFTLEKEKTQWLVTKTEGLPL